MRIGDWSSDVCSSDLSDALCHALALRHVDNAAYRRVLAALDPDLEHHPAVIASGGLGPFEQGLYGCSEMYNVGLTLLVERGVMRRRVVANQLLIQTLDEIGGASCRDTVCPYVLSATVGES